MPFAANRLLSRVGLCFGALLATLPLPACDSSASVTTGEAGSGATGGSQGGSGGSTGGSTGQGGAECTPPTPTAQPINVPAGNMTWVDFPDAFCANGKPTGIGVSPAPEGSNRLFIYLIGGGACWNKETCYDNPIAANITSGVGQAEFNAYNINDWWYFNRGAADNPFAKDHLVVVPYCTGDVHAGTQVTDHGGIATSHVGALNMAAYLKRLQATFPSVTHVVLAGGSAGGIGASFNWHRVIDAFPCARVDMIDDAAALLPPPYLQENLEQAWRTAWGLNAGLPADCAACLTDLNAIYPYSAAKSPNGRGAVMHGTLDSVVAFYFNLTQPQVAESLKALAEGTLNPIPNFRHYYVAGDHHGVFSPAFSQNGVPVPIWINQMLSGDPVWANVEPGDCADAGVCSECQSCALSGPCAAQVATCQAEPECLALFECGDTCAGDAACIQACIDQHPEGVDEATAVLQCVNEEVCFGLCQ
ncbi:MAG: hypothetical protein IPK82_25575 [Polyangiaceae bacterium]|nr:hypothetical protein [Polyangiaceae bacterium]